MKCPACGQLNRSQASFCAWCGHDLAPVPAANEERSPSEPRQADTDARKAEASATPTHTNDNETSPPTAPKGAELSVGELVSERYRITEIVEVSSDGIRYRANDLCRCAFCGHDQNVAGDDFCASCGAQLTDATTVELLERVPNVPEEYDTRFTAHDRDYYVRYDVDAPPTPTLAQPEPRHIRLQWGHASDAGETRAHNEDYVDVHLLEQSPGTTLGLFQVADGLGGQDSGEVASQLTAETVWQALRSTIWEPSLSGETLAETEIRDALIAAVEESNRIVLQERTTQHSDMSTTLTALLIVGNQAFVANVGDSRTYLWNAEGLLRITKDHSFVQRLVDAGALDAQDIYTHPKRNLIYQSIGDQNQIHPDVFTRDLTPDERYLLCSDGLWEMLRDEGIKEVLMAESDPQRACDRLVANANLAGGEDNISVVVVHITAEPTVAIASNQGGTHD